MLNMRTHTLEHSIKIKNDLINRLKELDLNYYDLSLLLEIDYESIFRYLNKKNTNPYSNLMKKYEDWLDRSSKKNYSYEKDLKKCLSPYKLNRRKNILRMRSDLSSNNIRFNDVIVDSGLNRTKVYHFFSLSTYFIFDDELYTKIKKSVEKLLSL